MKKNILAIFGAALLSGCATDNTHYSRNYSDLNTMFTQNGGLDRNSAYHKGFSVISNSDVKEQLRTNPLSSFAVGNLVMQERGFEAYRKAYNLSHLPIKPRLPGGSHTTTLASWTIFVEKQDSEYLKDAAAYRLKNIGGSILFIGRNPHCSNCGANVFNNSVKTHITEYTYRRTPSTLLSHCYFVGSGDFGDISRTNFRAYGASGQAHYQCNMAGLGKVQARYGAYSGDDNFGGGVRYFLEIGKKLPFSQYPYNSSTVEGIQFIEGLSPKTFGDALSIYAKHHHFESTAYSYDDPENSRFVINASTGFRYRTVYIPYDVYHAFLEKYKERIARFEANIHKRPYD